MIDLKSLAQFRNNEFIQLIDNLLTIVKDGQVSTLNIQEQYTVLENHYNKLTDSYTVNRKNDLSKTLSELDKKRDKLYLGLKTLIESHAQHNPNEAHQNLALSILSILKSHGSELIRMPYSEETVALNDIIDQVKEKQLEHHINATFHADMYFKALITTNDRFDRVYVDRIKDYGSQEKANIKELRAVVEEALGKMVERINAISVLQPSEHFQNVANEITAALELYMNNLKKRYSYNDSEEEEESLV